MVVRPQKKFRIFIETLLK